MKSDIHPVYYPQAQASCACGNTFTTGSTMQTLKLDICSACHPFFTGEMKYVDTAGRVDKFRDKMSAMNQSSFMKKKEKKAAKKEAMRKALMEAPQTMKEMMDKVKKEASTSDGLSKAKKATVKADPADSATTQGQADDQNTSTASKQDDEEKNKDS